MQNYQEIGETAFQNEMSNGSEPAVAMDTACEAVGGQMAEDGFPANIIEAATNGAVEEFNQVMDQGGEPGDAYSSAYDAGLAGGQEQFDDDMPDLDTIGIEAFSAALEGGATPAEAAEAAGGAVAQAAGEAGFPAEVIEAAMEAGQASFTAALEEGGDPQEAFTTALEVAGNTAETILNDAGVGPNGPDGPEGDVDTAPQGDDAPIPGDTAPQGDDAPIPGDTAPQGDAAPIPGDTAPQGDAAPIPGDTAPQGDAAPIPGDTAPQGDAAPIPGDTAPQGDAAPTFGSEAAVAVGGAAATAAANEAIEVADLGAPQGDVGPDTAAPQGDVGPNFDAINAEVQSAAPAVDNGPAPLDDDQAEVEVVADTEVADEVDPI
jgi:hypothetical protein